MVVVWCLGRREKHPFKFYRTRTKQMKETVLIIKLNPWRYNDEDALIRNFLK
jgi:predicted KAP-like P-loop ATPase